MEPIPPGSGATLRSRESRYSYVSPMEERLVRVDSLWRVVNYANPEKVARIAAAMRRDGWQGRPLLIEEDVDGRHSAWTGCHRISAAREAGLVEVPCRVITRRESQQYLDRLPEVEGYSSLREALTNPTNGGGYYDHQRLAGLRRLGFAEAAAALEEEIAVQEAGS